MTDLMPLIPALIAGALLGAFFFLGLYYTTRKALASPRPLLWLAGSFAARTLIVVGGFWAISGGDFKKIAAALAGFIIARLAVKILVPRPGKEKACA